MTDFKGSHLDIKNHPKVNTTRTLFNNNDSFDHQNQTSGQYKMIYVSGPAVG